MQIPWDDCYSTRCVCCKAFLEHRGGGEETISGPICNRCVQGLDNPPKPVCDLDAGEYVLVRGAWFHIGPKRIERPNI